MPREAMGAPSPEVLKVRLDRALSNPVWWEVSLPTAGGLELRDREGPFQPNPFCVQQTWEELLLGVR